ncbi:MAG: FtsW/RodA/SpoVE family cell cycle protein [bacterium]
MSIDGKIVRVNTEIDWILLFSSLLLLILGLIALYSIERIQMVTMGYSNVSFKSQVLYSTLGVICGLIAYRLHLRFIRVFAPYFLYISLFLLIITLFFGTSVKGGVRWLYIGGISIQASDIARLALIIYISYIFSKKQIGWNFYTLTTLIIICIFTYLTLCQPDYGSAMITFLVGLLMMFLVGMPSILFSLVFIISTFLGYRLIFEASYRERRFLAFLDPWKDPYGDGYQYIQALKAFTRGGILGVGLGMGQQKLNVLPEVHTDLILAHIGEELGLIVTIFVILLYILICIRMFKIALVCPFKFSRLVVLGFALSLTIQAMINIGGEIKLLPLTGVPLPLLSSGGTSRVVSLFMIGYALGVSRYKSEALNT